MDIMGGRGNQVGVGEPLGAICRNKTVKRRKGKQGLVGDHARNCTFHIVCPAPWLVLGGGKKGGRGGTGGTKRLLPACTMTRTSPFAGYVGEKNGPRRRGNTNNNTTPEPTPTVQIASPFRKERKRKKGKKKKNKTKGSPVPLDVDTGSRYPFNYQLVIGEEKPYTNGEGKRGRQKKKKGNTYQSVYDPYSHGRSCTDNCRRKRKNEHKT